MVTPSRPRSRTRQCGHCRSRLASHLLMRDPYGKQWICRSSQACLAASNKARKEAVPTTRVRLALLRILRELVDVRARCQCGSQVCSLCEAMISLGLGRWQGPMLAAAKLRQIGSKP